VKTEKLYRHCWQPPVFRAISEILSDGATVSITISVFFPVRTSHIHFALASARTPSVRAFSHPSCPFSGLARRERCPRLRHQLTPAILLDMIGEKGDQINCTAMVQVHLVPFKRLHFVEFARIVDASQAPCIHFRKKNLLRGDVSLERMTSAR